MAVLYRTYLIVRNRAYWAGLRLFWHWCGFPRIAYGSIIFRWSFLLYEIGIKILCTHQLTKSSKQKSKIDLKRANWWVLLPRSPFLLRVRRFLRIKDSRLIQRIPFHAMLQTPHLATGDFPIFLSRPPDSGEVKLLGVKKNRLLFRNAHTFKMVNCTKTRMKCSFLARTIFCPFVVDAA